MGTPYGNANALHPERDLIDCPLAGCPQETHMRHTKLAEAHVERHMRALDRAARRQSRLDIAPHPATLVSRGDHAAEIG